MESQKIINLLDGKDEDDPKFKTKKWFIINDRNNGQYSEGEENDPTIKIDTEVLKLFLCDYSDACILVTGNIKVTGGDENTKAAFKNCHPFTSEIHLNDEHVETTDNLDLIMYMYNLIEYSDNYSDSAASLYHFKRQEPFPNNANLTTAGSYSFKYKSDLLGNATVENGNAVWKNVQIMVPLIYTSNFFRSLELPLINRKQYMKLNWTKNSVISDGARNTTFQITKTELHVPVVTLKTEDNNKLNQLLNTESEGTICWNEYKSRIETAAQALNDNNFKRTLLDTSIPGVNRLFVMGFNYNDPTMVMLILTVLKEIVTENIFCLE